MQALWFVNTAYYLAHNKSATITAISYIQPKICDEVLKISVSISIYSVEFDFCRYQPQNLNDKLHNLEWNKYVTAPKFTAFSLHTVHGLQHSVVLDVN